MSSRRSSTRRGSSSATTTMPEEYRTQVFRFIELHANSELMGGLTERDWIPRAPGLRRKMARARQDAGRDRPRPPAVHGRRGHGREDPPADARGPVRRAQPVPQRLPLRGGDVGRPGRDRLPRRRRGADQPAGGVQELLVRPVQADPPADHRRGGLPHAPRRGDAAHLRRGHRRSSTSCSRRRSTGGGCPRCSCSGPTRSPTTR